MEGLHVTLRVCAVVCVNVRVFVYERVYASRVCVCVSVKSVRAPRRS
jgi:hypothetical protein